MWIEETRPKSGYNLTWISGEIQVCFFLWCYIFAVPEWTPWMRNVAGKVLRIRTRASYYYNKANHQRCPKMPGFFSCMRIFSSNGNSFFLGGLKLGGGSEHPENSHCYVLQNNSRVHKSRLSHYVFFTEEHPCAPSVHHSRL